MRDRVTGSSKTRGGGRERANWTVNFKLIDSKTLHPLHSTMNTRHHCSNLPGRVGVDMGGVGTGQGGTDEIAVLVETVDDFGNSALVRTERQNVHQLQGIRGWGKELNVSYEANFMSFFYPGKILGTCLWQGAFCVNI